MGKRSEGRRPRPAERLGAVACAVIAIAACGAPPEPLELGPPGLVHKAVSFAVLEDYDRGEDLGEVALDFDLMAELEVRTWRGSFGWDDYEPEPDVYQLEWLHDFVRLAAERGIELRPYIAYTPEWAAAGGEDDQAWNDPPASLDAWEEFAGRLAGALAHYPNVRSWEIYNEENVDLWWDGTVEEYNAVLTSAARAIREADPDAAVILGGLVWPDSDWMEATCGRLGNAAAFDIAAFHAYPETWTPEDVTVERYLGPEYHEAYVPIVDEECEGQPIWINEMGFATTPGRTEREQASWWVRAVATFLADPEIEHIGIYEIKDLPSDRPVIGDAPNYHLGLTTTDRTKKLAFHTVDLLTDLLDTGTLTVADAALRVRVVEGRAGELHHHLFIRPDGGQVLILWDRTASPTLEVDLPRAGGEAIGYELDGTGEEYEALTGDRLRRVRLEPGEPRIFLIRP